MEDMSSRQIGTQEKAGGEIRVFKSVSSKEDTQGLSGEIKKRTQQKPGPYAASTLKGQGGAANGWKKARQTQCPGSQGKKWFQEEGVVQLSQKLLVEKTGLVRFIKVSSNNKVVLAKLLVPSPIGLS